MALKDVTHDAVTRAIAEYRSKGRDAFLDAYGFGKARDYFIEDAVGIYDAKAILGAAHQFVDTGAKPLGPYDFKSGDKTVKPVLEALGFAVRVQKQLAPLEFKIGRVYNRRRDIHGPFGGQERGGIATPAGVPFVFLFTGEQGGQYGYQDGFRADGVFEYTGEGQVGDMEFVRGNRAIRDHGADGKELLLFQAQKKKGEYQFLGSFVCGDFDIRDVPDKSQAVRKGLVFLLTPLENLQESLDADVLPPVEDGLQSLRQAAYEAADLRVKPKTGSTKNIYARSRAVRDYVLARANGVCEACAEPAPFLRENGKPYLEPHHTRRLADGGLDHPRWVGGICPTCHRKIHHGAGGDTINEALQAKIKELEADNAQP